MEQLLDTVEVAKLLRVKTSWGVRPSTGRPHSSHPRWPLPTFSRSAIESWLRDLDRHPARPRSLHSGVSADARRKMHSDTRNGRAPLERPRPGIGGTSSHAAPK
jgi:hypothetical protein